MQFSSAKVRSGIDKYDELEANKLFKYIEEYQKNLEKIYKATR